MPVIVVETSVWIDRIRGRDTAATERVHALLADQVMIAVTDVVYAELLAGTRDEVQATALEAALRDIPVLRLRTLEDFRLAAHCRRATAAAGMTVRSLSDCLIAAACISHDVPLLHGDRDFDHIAACTPLKVVAPE